MRRAAALLLLLVASGCANIIGRPERPPPARVPPAKPLPPRPAPAKPPPAKRTDWVARAVTANAQITPQGRFHAVRPGETGIAIARAYGVPWRDLIALNGLKDPYVLAVGQRLRLPDAQAAAARVAAMSLEERARAFSLSIDDVVTGGQPAASEAPGVRPPLAGAAAERPVPLPAITGSAPRFRWPLPGRIISGFGPKAGGRFNDGVNLKANAGEAVRAAADGVVAYAGDAIAGFGNLLLIKHAGGWVSAYAHNEALLVARGARVQAGEVIARAGQTGAVAEPQLHFELRRGRAPVDPAGVIGGR
ncbi:MAG: M23 family metallopeptidase [Alphaproteobacteria bacterium]|nr:M23 family metallopeptidase [Alphaproteobacteria bacterium]